MIVKPTVFKYDLIVIHHGKCHFKVHTNTIYIHILLIIQIKIIPSNNVHVNSLPCLFRFQFNSIQLYSVITKSISLPQAL